YVRVEAGKPSIRSQVRFMELAREKAQSGPALPGAGGGYHVRTTPPARPPRRGRRLPRANDAPGPRPLRRHPIDGHLARAGARPGGLVTGLTRRPLPAQQSRAFRRIIQVMASFRSLALSVAVAGGLLAARSASASLVIALDLPAMVGRADHVGVVDVVSVKAAWDASHEKILSTIDLAVVETWKGQAAPASHFTIVQRGGTVDDASMVVYGMPTSAPGERAVLFLEGQPGHARVVWM